MIPNLSQAPDDKRDDLISTSLIRPDRESQPSSKRNRKIETYAATAAAYLGILFSKTENVTIGGQLGEDDAPKHKPNPDSTDNNDEQPAKPPATPLDHSDDLVPWVNLQSH